MIPGFEESVLWAGVLQGEWPRSVGRWLGIPSERVVWLCAVWADMGVYSCKGSQVDMGVAVREGAS